MPGRNLSLWEIANGLKIMNLKERDRENMRYFMGLSTRICRVGILRGGVERCISMV